MGKKETGREHWVWGKGGTGFGNLPIHCSTEQLRNIWLQSPFFLTLMISPFLGYGGEEYSQSSGYLVGHSVPSGFYLLHYL